MDITSKEILEDAINNYTGTVLYVSHDRYFINRTADRILDLRDNVLTEYLGDYDYYVEKREQLTSQAVTASNISVANNTAKNEQAALDYKAQKEAAAKAKRQAKELEKLEAEIEKLENQSSEIDEWLNDPRNGTDTAGLIKKQKEKEAVDEQLLLLMDKWELLSE